MKRLRVYINLLASAIRSHRVTYGIYILCVAACIAAATYFFNQVLVNDSRDPDGIKEELPIELRSISSSAFPKVQTIIKDHKDLFDNVKMEYLEETMEGTSVYYATMRKDPNIEGFYRGGDVFEYPDDAMVVAVAEQDYHNLMPKAEAVVKGKKYKVVGQVALPPGSVMLPFKTFQKNFEANSVELNLVGSPNGARLRSLEEKLRGLGNTVDLTMPTKAVAISKSGVYSVTPLIFSLAAVNFAYLYGYILMVRRRDFGLLRLNGCTNRNLMGALLFEVAVTFTAAYLLGLGIFLLLYQRILPAITREPVPQIYYGDLFFLYFIFLAMVLLVNGLVLNWAAGKTVRNTMERRG